MSALIDRRYQALQLLEEGLSVAEVAARLRCARSSVYRWRVRFQNDGPRGLAVRSSSGRPHRLSADMVAALHRALGQAPRAAGVYSAYWTTDLVVDFLFSLTRHRAGTRYTPASAEKLLRKLGYRQMRKETTPEGTRCPAHWRSAAVVRAHRAKSR